MMIRIVKSTPESMEDDIKLALEIYEKTKKPESVSLKGLRADEPSNTVRTYFGRKIRDYLKENEK